MQEVFNYMKMWVLDNNGKLTLLGKGLKILVIFILVKTGIKVSNVVIDKVFKEQNRFKYGIDKKKANTLSLILKSIVKYVIYFVGFITILDVFGIDTDAILAAAGVGGIAVGFGAQNLVRDVITGFFILFEDQFSVGDHVETKKFDGIVEELGIRVTKIRSFSGELHIIPNGMIDTVTNKSRGAMRAWVDIGIAYEEDIDNAINVLNKLFEDMQKKEADIVEGPTVLGVSNLGASDIVISIIAKTEPMKQWDVERKIRKRVKEVFDLEGIEIPYPRTVVIKKEE